MQKRAKQAQVLGWPEAIRSAIERGLEPIGLGDAADACIHKKLVHSPYPGSSIRPLHPSSRRQLLAKALEFPHLDQASLMIATCLRYKEF